jgi:repressor LexA
MKNLHIARTTKGMTQEQVAGLLGVHRTTYNRYEKGLRSPDLETVSKLATIFGVTTDYLLGSKPNEQDPDQIRLIPLLGSVPAGTPIEAIEDIEEYIDIYPRFVKHGELFALRVQGDSMEPDLRNGDIVVIEKQEYVENGQIAVVRVNGEDFTIKRVKLSQKGLMLIPSNPAYDPVFFDSDQVATLPVTIIGVVIEIRRRL